jgi:molybdopterin-guanine dinucleotide biosynthesis protein MobB
MIIATLIGLKKCGKTTTAEALIGEFRRRSLRVGAVKFMPNSTMTLDMEGKDTYRHRQAGADFVISLSKGEVAFIGDTDKRADLDDALKLIPDGTDIVICEGLNTNHPDIVRIVLARDADHLEETLKVRDIGNDITAISGIISGTGYGNRKIPVLDATDPEQIKSLADLIIEKGK